MNGKVICVQDNEESSLFKGASTENLEGRQTGDGTISVWLSYIFQ